MENINSMNLKDDELKMLQRNDLGYLRLPKTPTNKSHPKFLTKLKNVKGITNHGILFSKQEEIQPEEDEDIEERLADNNNVSNFDPNGLIEQHRLHGQDGFGLPNPLNFGASL